MTALQQPSKKRHTRRPGEARPTDPHWIVTCLSKNHEQPVEQPKLRFYFRHLTEESANREAANLSEQFPGRRFAVYGSGHTFKAETMKFADREYDSWFAGSDEADIAA